MVYITPIDSESMVRMRFYCRIGLHRWEFNTQLVDEPGHHTYTEIIHARCTRDGCVRYSEWSPVHHETSVGGPAATDSPTILA